MVKQQQLILMLAPVAMAFSPSAPAFVEQKNTALKAMNVNVNRADFIKTSLVAAGVTLLNGPTTAAFAEDVKLDSGVSYVVTTAGEGPKPDIGELAAIRFKATYGDNVIDDIFGTPEPYYTRVGSGGLLKGIEEVIPKMRVGDRFLVTIPSNLAFGPKGRPASAGKPRIPGGAEIIYDVEMVGLPGKEPELIELIGDV